MNFKKAQGEIITTVLIILLILAAIVIVWQVVSTSVKSSAEEIPGQTDCLTIDIEMVKVTNATSGNLILKRGSNEGTVSRVKVYFGDSTTGYTYLEDVAITLNPMEQRAFNITNVQIKNSPTAPGKYLKIAKVIGTTNPRTCEYMGYSAENGVLITSS